MLAMHMKIVHVWSKPIFFSKIRTEIRYIKWLGIHLKLNCYHYIIIVIIFNIFLRLEETEK